MNWTIEGILKWTTEFFTEKKIASPRLDAELLLCKILKCDRLRLFLDYKKPLIAEELSEFKKLIQKRATHYPLQYLTGVKEFMALELNTAEGVFIPRCDTETLVVHVLDTIEKNPVNQPDILEIGNGTGAILISLCHYQTNARGIGIDVNPKATLLAQDNSLKHHLESRTKWIHIPAEEYINQTDSRFDYIVSNPPYLCKGDPEIEYQVREFEPQEALYAEESGYAFYRFLMDKSPVLLRNNGFLCLEIGIGMEERIRNLPHDNTLYFIETKKDLAGTPRSMLFQKRI